MDTREFATSLKTLGWSNRALARVLGVHETRVRRWASGAVEIPPDIASWLERLAAAHEANPVPGKKS